MWESAARRNPVDGPKKEIRPAFSCVPFAPCFCLTDLHHRSLGPAHRPRRRRDHLRERRRMPRSTMEAQPKPTSRFSTLNVFGKFSAAKPPPPPPKDNWYLQAKASASTLSFAPSSVASSSHGRNGVGNVQHSPASAFGVTASQSQYNLALPRNMSPTPSTSASTISMTLSASASTYSVNTTSTETSTAGSTFRRGLSKLSALGKRPFFGKAAKGSRQWEIDQDGVKSAVEEDDTISRPYDVHVSRALHCRFCYVIIFSNIWMHSHRPLRSSYDS